MKKILYTLTAAILFAGLAGCENFLDKQPLDKIGSETELAQAEATALINGAYQPLMWPKLYNLRIWANDVIASESNVGGELTPTDGIETKDLQNFTATSTNAAALDIWRGPNPGILRCNLVLRDVPELDIDPAKKRRILGEAHFLRAHYYFILVRIFGGVPLRTEPLAAGDDLNIARASKEKVYELIIQDCKDAITMLPYKSQYSPSDLGRACKEAAMCQLAKVYLTLAKNYDLVEQLCQQIEDLGYDLSTMDYLDNFDPLTKNGPESLFEIQYTGSTEYSFWDNENQASWLSTYMGPRDSGWVGGSWGWQHVQQHFVDAYEPGDLRKDWTILYEGCPLWDGKTYNPVWSLTGYNVRKFLVPKSISSDYNTSPSNFVVYRFADVLLMKAEALNEQKLTEDAAEPLNKVRERAGLTGVNPNLSYEEMKEAIIHERRMELAFEGHRWFDLIRIDGGDYAVNFFMSIGQTNVTKDRLLYPIPQEERDANPLIEQNPGY